MSYEKQTIELAHFYNINNNTVIDLIRAHGPLAEKTSKGGVLLCEHKYSLYNYSLIGNFTNRGGWALMIMVNNL